RRRAPSPFPPEPSMSHPVDPPPSTARKIVIARYPTTGGAKIGLDQLKNAGTRLGNVAVIEREVDGKIGFTETQDWGIGKSAAVGALAAIILPGIGPVMGALAGGLAAYFIDAGFPDDLLRQLGSGLEVGGSMLVALVREEDLPHAEQVITAGGGVVIGSGFEPDLGAALERMRNGGAS
ncbi:MAG TPA: DUF1269 domain-containing protein, partial [Gemmatimonadaceae bacterium]|nr:DUF1269 domain-containing protein [Gemmatimonadaceae bacterium]